MIDTDTGNLDLIKFDRAFKA